MAQKLVLFLGYSWMVLRYHHGKLDKPIYCYVRCQVADGAKVLQVTGAAGLPSDWQLNTAHPTKPETVGEGWDWAVLVGNDG